MNKTSIIVPIYHGKKYIANIIAQVENCVAFLGWNHSVELVMVNDAPDEILGEYCSKSVHIKVMETDINRGIHGARVHGLAHASGEYILFLDQDDLIAPEYLQKQLAAIGDADAVVCRLIHAGKQFYNHTFPMEKIINLEFTLSKGTPMISPGQVLIKKEAIPEFWKNNIMQNNGADDWFLWICMMKETRKFAINQNILFEHVVDGKNASMQALKMHRSEKELLEKLRKYPLMSQEEIEIFQCTVQNTLERYLEWLEKYQALSFLYDRWLVLKEKQRRISSYLREKELYRIAIYGVTDAGKRLCEELQKDGMDVMYFIDRNAPFLNETIPVYPLKEGLPETDIVIISLVQYEKEIIENLRMIGINKAITIFELIGQVERR